MLHNQSARVLRAPLDTWTRGFHLHSGDHCSFVLLCFIDLKVRKIRNKASSCSGIFSRSCMLVCLDSVHTLEIISRILSQVVNRERLCSTSVFYFGCFCNLWGRQTPCRSTDTIYLVRLFAGISSHSEDCRSHFK